MRLHFFLLRSEHALILGHADNLQLGYIEAFMAKNGGRFPSYDGQWRRDYQPRFKDYQAGVRSNATFYADKLAPKKELVAFIESDFFKADNETCSDSIMVYDIGALVYYVQWDRS